MSTPTAIKSQQNDIAQSSENSAPTKAFGTGKSRSVVAMAAKIRSEVNHAKPEDSSKKQAS
ncbi:MAG: hypothetical protein NTV34_15780 [Proteobacteria bacterium]|nr:hypothetical protein [Pseudomonadota bacterium]